MTRLALLALCLTASTLLAEDPVKFPVGGLEFSRPAAWTWVPVSSPMRKAQLRVPGATAESGADITFFHFGAGGGGGAQANIQRWLGQFQSKEGVSKVEPQEIGGTKVTLVTTEGTFNSGMPGGPTTPLADHALLGAIVEHPEGDVFVKMTGPAALVKGSRPAFLDFLGTALKAAKK
jgi:hypothetical protein